MALDADVLLRERQAFTGRDEEVTPERRAALEARTGEITATIADETALFLNALR